MVKETKAAKTMWTRTKALAKDPEFQFQMFVKCLLTASSSAKKVQSGKYAANATFWNKQCQEPRPGNACQPGPVSIQLQLRDVALSAIAVQVCCGAAGVSNTLRPFDSMIYPGDHFILLTETHPR